jgi:hypothetical protein
MTSFARFLKLTVKVEPGKQDRTKRAPQAANTLQPWSWLARLSATLTRRTGPLTCRSALDTPAGPLARVDEHGQRPWARAWHLRGELPHGQGNHGLGQAQLSGDGLGRSPVVRLGTQLVIGEVGPRVAADTGGPSRVGGWMSGSHRWPPAPGSVGGSSESGEHPSRSVSYQVWDGGAPVDDMGVRLWRTRGVACGWMWRIPGGGSVTS